MELHIEKLKAIRKRKKISADELAAKAGISRVTLSSWENARRSPSEAKIRMLATALDVPVNEISDLEPDKPVSKINLTPLGTNIGSILSGEKEKDINRQKNLVSGLMGILKELSNAKMIIGTMISSLPSIFYIKGSDLKYMTASEAFLTNLGLNKNFDVVGKTDYDFFPENEAKINAEMDKYVIASGGSILDKEGYIPGTRKTKWSIFSKIPVYDSEGNIEGLLGFFKDITARKQSEEILKQNKERLELAYRAAGAGYWDWDMTSQRFGWARELFVLFGLNPDVDKASFETWKKVVHPDDYEEAHKRIEQAIIEKKFFINEYRIIRPDGQLRWISALGNVVYSSEGQALSMTGICTDITERKLAEEAVNQSKERLELAYRAAGAGYWDWDMTSQQLGWSRELFILFGLDPDKEKASFGAWKKTVHPDDYDKAYSRLEQAIKEKKLLINEYRIIRPDGQLRWISVLGNIVYSPEGEPLSITGICTDITELKLAGMELQQSKERLELAIQAAGAAHWDWDMTSQSLDWSRELFMLYGLDPDTGKATFDTWKKIVHPDDYATANHRIQHSIKEKSHHVSEYRIIRPDGQERWIHSFGKITRSPSGKPLRMTGICIDITDRKMAEAELQQSRQRLELAIQAVGAAHWDWDITNHRLDWSRELFILLGLDPDKNEASPDIWEKSIHPDDYENVHRLVQLSIKNNTHYSSEYRVVLPDGQVRWISSFGKISRSTADKSLRMTGICIDITDRKMAEEELKQSRQRLELAYRAAGAGHWEWDVVSRKLYWSRELFMLFGLDPDKDEASFDIWRKALHPGDRESAYNRTQYIIKEKLPFFNEYRVVHPDGQVRWISSLGSTTYGPSGEPLRVTGISIDITARKIAEEKLRQTNDYLENLLNYANAPVIVWDPQFRITRFNHAFEFLTGRSEAEVLGKSLKILFPPALAAHSMEMIRQTSSGDRWESVEIEIMHRDKSTRTVLWNSATLFAEDGKTPVATIAQGQDITGRKKAEDNLQHAIQQLKFHTENTPLAVVELNNEHRITQWSDNAEKMFGWKADEVIGKKIHDFKWIYDGDKKSIALLNASMLSGNNTSNVNINRNYRKDGSVITCEWYNSGLLDSNGKLLSVYSLANDITARIQAEEKQRETNDYLENLLNYASAPVIVWDPQFRITRFNHAFELLTGRSEEEVLGKSLKILFPTELAGNSMELIRQTASGERWKSVEIEIMHRDKSTRTVLWNSSTLFADDGKTPVATIAQGQDITERKLAENTFRENYSLLRTAGKIAKFGGWSLDVAENRVIWSEEIADMHEMSAGGSLVQNEGVIFCAPEWREKMDSILNTCVKDGIAFDEELEIITVSGKRVWVRTTGEAIRNKNGKIIKIQGSLQNISERKQAEHELAGRAREYRVLAENSPDLIARFDRQLRHIYVNPAAAAAGSRPPEAYIGKTMDDLAIPESVRSIWDERIHKVFDTGELIDVIDSFPFADGLHYFHTRVVPERDSDGSIQSVITFARDITERKLMDDKLQHAMQQLKFHTENTPLAVVEFNNEYRITRWSGNAEKIFGWKADEVLGKKIQDMRWVYDDDRKTVASLSANMLSGNTTSNVNINRNYRKDGSIITCEWYNSALTDPDGRLISVYSLINDITARVQAEEALRESELFFKESQQAAFIGSYKSDFTSGCWESSEVLDQIMGIDKDYSRTVQGWLEIVHPDDRETTYRFFKEDVFTKHRPFSREYRIIRRSDGKIRQVNDAGKVVFDAGGKPVSIIGTVQDITERRQREKD